MVRFRSRDVIRHTCVRQRKASRQDLKVTTSSKLFSCCRNLRAEKRDNSNFRLLYFIYNSTCANAIFCCIVFKSKSREIFNHSPNSTKGKLKPIQSRVNVFPKLRKVRACSIKTLRSHGIQESAHLAFFT